MILSEPKRLTTSPSFLSVLNLFYKSTVNDYIPLKMKVRVEHPIVLEQKVAECVPELGTKGSNQG